MRRPLVVLSTGLLVALLLVPVLLVPVDAAPAQTADDARAQREQVRGQRAQVAAQIDALHADDAQLDQAARDVDENLRLQQALLTDAEQAAQQAVQQAADAQAAADARAAALDALEAQVRQFAVDAYVNPPGNDLLDRLKADNASDAAQKAALLDLSANRAADVVDQLRAARVAYQQERDRADRARADAEQRQADAKARTVELQQARSAQVQFASQLEQRLNAQLAEADALAGQDAQLSATIAADQAATAARLRAMAPTLPSGPSTPSPPSKPSEPSPPVVPPPNLSVPLTTVRGITVNSSIAGRLESMLGAAAADGIVLGGSGYRDPARQVALRRQNCGTSNYAIYVMPSYLCSPPTAIPGSSLHEQGLAVDFSWKGQSLTGAPNAAFLWLSANASRFGFYNLPSEPWHWSISGR